MDTVIWQLLVQLFLIALNAFFAASEVAVLSLNEVKVRRMIEEGDTKAKKMLRMVEESARFLSAIQIGITLTSCISAAFAADHFLDRLVNWLQNTCNVTFASRSVLDTLSVIVITLILSFFTLPSELQPAIPKNWQGVCAALFLDFPS